MEIIKITESRREEYDGFVSSHSRGTFLQSWAWGEWQNSQGKMTERYLFISNNKLVGVAQTVLMNTFLGSYVYCPYGPLLATDLNDETIKNIFCLLKKQLAAEQNILFIRIEPTTTVDLKTIGAVKAETVQPPQTLLKNISSNEEELMQSFHQKTRYNIRVAQKHGIQVSTHSEVNDDAIDLIMQTSDRQGYRSHSVAYIKSLWQFFSEISAENSDKNSQNIKVTGYLAEKGGTALASGLMVDFGTTRMYLFGGSSYEHRNLMAPYLMHWQAMLDAKTSGFKLYDFGGAENASGHSGGYARFKLGFNPQVINFTGTHDLVVQHGRYTVYQWLRKFNRIRLHLFSK